MNGSGDAAYGTHAWVTLPNRADSDADGLNDSEELNLGSDGFATGPALRGIRLNPNRADTDGDGLADGQELFVKTAKTPKRYPTRDWAAVYTEKVDLSLGSPAWAIARAVRPI